MSEGTTTEEVTLDLAPRFRSHVALVPIEDEAILYEDGVGTLHQLNASAAAVCALFDGEVTLATLVEDLDAVLEEDRARLETDLLQLTRDLATKGLLEGIGPGPVDADPVDTGDDASPDEPASA